jgi:hypothetical protein
LNHDELKQVCYLNNCEPSDLGLVAKELILKKINEDRKLTRVKQIEELAKKEKIKKLKKVLGINEHNAIRKTQANGLYYQKNVEEYLMKFIDNWNGDIHKIAEISFTMDTMLINELYMREYLHRVTL